MRPQNLVLPKALRAPEDEAQRVVAVEVVFLEPHIGRDGELAQLGGLAAQGVEGHAVAGEQRRRDVHLPLRAQAVEAGVQNDGAGAFLVRLGVVLAVGEPVEKFVGVEVEMRRDLRELVKARAVVRLGVLQAMEKSMM